MIKFVVSTVDYGETCNGKAGIYNHIFDSRKDAVQWVHEDMRDWLEYHFSDKNYNSEVKFDFTKMYAYLDNDMTIGCEWNIHEIKIPC